jgi:hypothetical protein
MLVAEESVGEAAHFFRDDDVSLRRRLTDRIEMIKQKARVIVVIVVV